MRPSRWALTMSNASVESDNTTGLVTCQCDFHWLWPSTTTPSVPCPLSFYELIVCLDMLPSSSSGSLRSASVMRRIHPGVRVPFRALSGPQYPLEFFVSSPPPAVKDFESTTHSHSMEHAIGNLEGVIVEERTRFKEIVGLVNDVYDVTITYGERGKHPSISRRPSFNDERYVM